MHEQVKSWTEAMRRADFALAWQLADETLASQVGKPCGDWPRHQQYIWDGSPLEGKRVLVRCYHGLGDTVQFIRFAPWLRARAAEVIVWAQSELIPLLRTAEGIDRLLPLNEGEPEVSYDHDVELMELAHVGRVTVDTIGRAVPYLRVPPVEEAVILKTRFNVGVVWQAGNWDVSRSIPVAALAPLMDVGGVTFFALQHGPALMEWPREWGPVCPAMTVLETAQWMQALDLIISVDSFPAHLAGALGRPVWTLLPREADWRWLELREDSPWYPTMRLFRQECAGDWTSVIARVVERLRRMSTAG